MLVSIGLKSAEKKFTMSFNPVFFSQYFISECFALNWYIFVVLTNKKQLVPLLCRLYLIVLLIYLIALFDVNLLFDCVKLIEYIASGFNIISSNPCVGPSPKINISLFLLSIWTDELI